MTSKLREAAMLAREAIDAALALPDAQPMTWRHVKLAEVPAGTEEIYPDEGPVYFIAPSAMPGMTWLIHVPQPVIAPEPALLTDEQIDLVRCSTPIPQSTDNEYLQVSKTQLRYFARAVEAAIFAKQSGGTS